MIGTKFSKQLITPEDLKRYTMVAEWCNQNGATIAERDEYYEVVEAPTPKPIVWNDDVTNLQMAIIEQYEKNLMLQKKIDSIQASLNEINGVK